MGVGKMRWIVDIVKKTRLTDADGFVVDGDGVLATVHAYREQRYASERWANLATFSEANALFRLRTIPDVCLDTTMHIVCDGRKYEILRIEDYKGRGMYYEVLAREVEPSG